MVLGIGIFFLLVQGSNYKKNQSEKALFFLFLVLSANLVYSLLIDSKIIEQYPVLYVLFNKGYILHLLTYPLLMAFIQTYTRNKVQKILLLLLMVPPIWLFGNSLFNFIQLEPVLLEKQVSLFLSDQRPGPNHVFRSPFLIFFTILIPGFVLFQISREIKYFLEEGVFKQAKYLLSIFASLATLIFILRLSSYPIELYFYREYGISFIEWKIDIIFNALFILILSASAMLHRRLEELGEIELGVEEKKKTASITTRDLAKLSSRIKEMVIEQEFYRNPGITLDDLSRELNINSKYLSMAINQGMGKSFPDYINACRMEKAKELLLSDRIKTYSVEAIAEESGFNSRATFYRVFKKETGISPLTWREKLLNS